MFRIGHGYDVHAFGKGDHIILGGVRIPCDRGLIAHSDGDVVLHAVCDALLGAAALGDIGHHFPDSDQRYKNADSRMLLTQVASLLTDKGFRVGNLDVTIIAQVPRMAPSIPQMVLNIAEDLRIPTDVINLKATTTEKLGYIGRGEGIAVHAVTLILASG